MANYELIPYKKGRNSFRTKHHSFLSDAAIQKKCTHYLRDTLVNENGIIKKYYQVHTKEITHINTTMAYNIECPNCRTQLKIHNLYSDGNKHSWYI